MAKLVEIKNFPELLGGQSGPVVGPLLGFGVIVVGKTAAAFPTSLNPSVGVRFMTSSRNKVYLGDSTVTSDNGYQLVKNVSEQFPVADTGTLWLVATKDRTRVSWVAF